MITTKVDLTSHDGLVLGSAIFTSDESMTIDLAIDLYSELPDREIPDDSLFYVYEIIVKE